MIVFIEGPRECGKSYLIDSFFKQNTNPNIIYYKFAFAKYLEELDLKDQEVGPGVHYFSISNVLTILELNKTFFKDKIMVFDRSIYSAYVWSIYRKRMDKQRLLNEFSKILSGDLYENCALIYLTRDNVPTLEKRQKDYFGNFENYDAEKLIFEEVLENTKQYQISKNNIRLDFVNEFTEDSVKQFNLMISNLAILDNK